MPSPTGELANAVPLGRSAPVGRLGLRSCSSAVHVRDLSARLSRASSTNRGTRCQPGTGIRGQGRRARLLQGVILARCAHQVIRAHADLRHSGAWSAVLGSYGSRRNLVGGRSGPGHLRELLGHLFTLPVPGVQVGDVTVCRHIAWLGDYSYILRARSFHSCHRARALALGRAHLASEATEVCPDLAISIGVDARPSASWVSAVCLVPHSPCSVMIVLQSGSATRRSGDKVPQLVQRGAA